MGLVYNYINDSQACGDEYQLVVTNQIGGELSFALQWYGAVSTECPAGLEPDNPTWTFTIVNDAPVANEIFGPYHAGTIPATIDLTLGPLAGLRLEIDSTNFLKPILRVAGTSPIVEFSGLLRINATIGATDQCGNTASASVLQSLGFPNPIACMVINEVAVGTGEFSFTDCSNPNGCSSGITSWTWFCYRAGSSSIVWSYSGQNPPNFTYSVPGNYEIVLTVTSDCGINTIRRDLSFFSTAECLELSRDDFAIIPWDVATNYDLNGIEVEPDPSSNIVSIDTRPNGTIYDPDSIAVETAVWNGANQRYEPASPLTLYAGNWGISIPPMTVTLRSGAICEIGYQAFFRIVQPDSCSDLSDNDWLYNEWSLNADGYLLAIDLLTAPGSNIASISGYPAGTLYDEFGAPVDTISWDGTNYVPDLGPGVHLVTGAWSAQIPAIPVITTAGQVCTLDWQQGTTGTADPPPEASSVVLDAASYAAGDTATVSYVYSDPSVPADPEDVAATVANILWRSYDGPTGGAGETLLQTGGLTYVVQPADGNRYITATVTPYAISGTSPGSPVESARSSVRNFLVSGSTTKQTSFGISLQGTNFAIDWGDGSPLENFSFGGSYLTAFHSYASPGTYNWVVYGDSATTYQLSVSSQQITGALDMSGLTACTTFSLYNNAGLTSVVNPASAALVTTYHIYTCPALTALDLSPFTNLGGSVQFFNDTSITSVTFGSSPQVFTQLWGYGCTSWTGGCNLSGYSNLGGWFAIQNCGNIGALTLPTSPQVFNNFTASFAGITGVVDLSGLTNLGGVFTLYGNTGITSIIAPSSPQAFTLIYVYGCTACTNANFAGLTGGFTDFRAYNLPSCTSFSLPGGHALAVTEFQVYNTGFTGNMNLSGYTNIGGGTPANILVRLNPNMTGLTLPASMGTIASLEAYSCNLTGTLDLSNMTTFRSTGSNILLHTNPNLTAITPAVSSTGKVYWHSYNCNITGTLDLSGYLLWSQVRVHLNANMTALTLSASTESITTFEARNCNLSTLNVSGFTNLSGVFDIDSNANLTSFTGPGSPTITSPSFTSFKFQSCNLTGAVDLSDFRNLGGYVSLSGNANLTGVTFATTSGTLTTLHLANCNLTGTLDISGLNLSVNLWLYTNPALTGLTVKATTAAAMTNVLLYGCALGYFDITGWTLSSALIYRIDSNGLTTAEVNHLLFDLDTVLSTGTGTLNLTLNAAPDGGTGGYDGITAKNNLIAGGFAVSTA